MPAGDFDFTCEQGATFQRIITYQDATGSAVNLTNYAIRMDVRRAKTKESDLIISLTNANGRATVFDAANGKIKLLIAASDTANFTPGSYFYDLEVESSSSPPVVERLIGGNFIVDAEVTG